MKTLSLHRFNLVVLLMLFLLTPIAFAQSGLVISQIYGGGGNTGAPYTNDFVELYNPTSAAISLSGYSIQYASATGTSWSNTTALPSSSVAPGQYFLIKGAGGTVGAALPTPDFTITTNLSGTAGKVALVSNTTILTGTPCPTANTAAIVDLVGYGSTATCYEGSGPTGTLSNTTAAIRTNPAVDTNNNAADFTVGAPNPHNSTYGSVSSSLSATGVANPSTVTSGSQTLLTVTVTPGGSPTSTGIAVTANLAAIGGSSTQAFYDDGTHGDATAGDNIFSFSTTATTTSYGATSLPVSVTDAQTRTAATTISLTVNQPVAFVPIHTIQGHKSLTATSVSTYAGTQVSTSGIVTAVGSVGFFIQAKDSDADSDPMTPEGIYVYMGTGKVPANAVIGNEVLVTGAVSTYPAVTASHTPATEIGSATVSLLTTGNALPTPVKLTTSTLTPAGGIYQLTPYEGMRVTIDSITTASGTGGSLTETSETEASNGQFYAVISGTARPFREPGIDIRDTLPTGAPANIARFDDNPERILVDSSFLGGTPIDLSTGTVLQSISGVLDFTYSSDSYYDPSRLLLDKTYSTVGNLSGGSSIQPVPTPANQEFTVAAFNVERFFNTSSADNIYYNPVTATTSTSSAVNVTQAAYSRRLAKTSLAIRTVLGTPDIVTLEEVENQSVVNDIATQISSDAIAAGQTDPQYVAYSTGTTYAPYTNDIGGISVGFLVKSTRVSTVSVDQYGQNTIMTDPVDGSQIVLNDRPPLVLHAGVKRTGAKDYPVTVIVNHLRSLSGIDDPTTGAYVRAKKELQAEFLANLIQGFQSNGEHVIAVGDYNVFEFSDGYTDVMATITGQGLLPADQVVLPGAAALVNPSATDLVTLLPSAQRWSYQEDGSAQVLDHIVATSDLVAAGAHIAYAHFDADFPLVSYNDATTPARCSDHDAAVGYFAIPSAAQAPLGNLDIAVDSATSKTTISTWGTLYVSGWAADPVDGAPLANVKIYIDGVSIGTPTLGLARPDVASYYNNAAYANSGFTLTYSASTLSAGAHAVTAIATNSAGLSTTLGSINITVNSTPQGNLDMAVDSVTSQTTLKTSGTLFVSGWAADPADGAPLGNVKIYIDGASIGTPTLGLSRPDVASYFGKPAYTNSGFTLTYKVATLSVGTHTVSAIATNSAGVSTTLGSTSITVTADNKPPVGNLDIAVDNVTVTTTVSQSDALYVAGWAADYEDNGPASSVQVLIDGTLAGNATLGVARSDVASYFGKPAWANSGWVFVMSASTLAQGAHIVNAVAYDSTGLSTTLGTMAITVQ